MRIIGSLKLGTPQERVKLLKAGADGKLIEKLYVERNNFKIVSGNVLFNLTDDINIIKKLQPYENAIIVPIREQKRKSRKSGVNIK